MLAFLLLVGGVLLNGCDSAPITIGLPSLPFGVPSGCTMNVANISHKETQLQKVLCHLEELVDSLQGPLVQTGGSTNVEVYKHFILVCVHVCVCMCEYISHCITAAYNDTMIMIITILYMLDQSDLIFAVWIVIVLYHTCV